MKDNSRLPLSNAVLKDVVVVSDCVVRDSTEYHHLNDELDMVEHDHNQQFIDGLSQYIENITIYTSPEDLIGNFHKHKDAIIFPNWFGKRSRNRFALLPAICESLNLRYVGGDAYIRLICNDKSIAKFMAKTFGFETPRWIIAHEEKSLRNIEHAGLKWPVVIKPNMENSSMGITQESKVFSYEDARRVATQLWEKFQGAVIAEEFCPGREINICILGNQNQVSVIEAGERFVTEDPSFLHDKLLDIKLKKDHPCVIRNVSQEIPEAMIDLCKNIFLQLGKLETLRMDFRVNDAGWHLIEMTPDPDLRPNLNFVKPLLGHYKSYGDILWEILNNSDVQ